MWIIKEMKNKISYYNRIIHLIFDSILLADLKNGSY